MSDRMDKILTLMRSAVAKLERANIREASIYFSEATGLCGIDVRRAFAISGTISVRFEPEGPHNAIRFEPVVYVNFPASNKGIVEATAFQCLVNELVPLAASLQVELSEEARKK